MAMNGLPPEAQRWGRFVEKSRLEIENTVKAVGGDISARFTGLSVVVDNLGDQVSRLDAYAAKMPDSSILHDESYGWITPADGWGTVASISLVSPDYRANVSIYAAAHARIASPLANYSSGLSRISVEGFDSPDMPGIASGPNSMRRWGLSATHSFAFLAEPNSPITIEYLIYNGSTSTVDDTEASLAAMASFSRVAYG